ncbi:MAG: 3-phosphoshikimate 1-carboxyvinyltransferase [Thiotrichales bacterium]|nr:MAG: 3-phosphoshikimate 1-carboxyvinyltransferase [Thiotrichales bacterium]
MPSRTISKITQFLKTTITLTGSKSITNRALLIAAMADGESRLNNVLFSDDTNACIDALKFLGVTISQDNDVVCIKGICGKFPRQNTKVYCHDAGTVARFLTPLCAAQRGGEFYVFASTQLSNRPIKQLLDVLEQQGCKFSFENNPSGMPFTIETNGLAGGKIFIDSSKSSQFLSGLLMAAPFARQDSYISTNANARAAYVNITLKMMQDFGVTVRISSDGSYVISASGNDFPYKACDYNIEPDASTASYFFALGALHGEVSVQHLSRNSLQGDIKFLDVLEAMGCKIIYSDDSITVIKPAKLSGVTVNMQHCSDTFMTIACIAPFADSPTTITNIAHTRLQESDRIACIAMELEKLGMRTNTTDDSITIFPGVPKAVELDSHNDHRIAMSLALIGTKISGVMMNNADAVNKTCPDFFARLEKISVTAGSMDS